jgi:peptidoglycan/LPS O-acetylase OafA/YrhL
MPSTNSAPSHRFAALDGMRGVCALTVLLYHAFRFDPHRIFEHGYLSVDIFFLLSGFVLAFAFADKFASGYSLDAFLRARVVRLWPVLVLGAVLSGVGLSATEYAFGFHRDNLIAVAVNIVESIALIPRVAGDGLAFPINGNLWSLFAEFWVNVAFALFIVRLGKRSLLAIMLLGWAFFAFEAYAAGTADLGPTAATGLLAIPRALPTFTCGVWLYRLWREGLLRRLPSVPPVVVFCVWLGIALVPADRFGVAFDLAQIILTAPLMIALLASWRGTTPALAMWLGRISYPLYATQGVFVTGIARVALLHGPISHGAEIAIIVLSLAAAEIAARWWQPWLMSRFARVLQTGSAVATRRPRDTASALPG